MLNTTILRPAYGKRYDTIEAAKAAWENGTDFALVSNGQYCSIRDLPRLQYCLTTVYIFLSNLNRTITVSTH